MDLSFLRLHPAKPFFSSFSPEHEDDFLIHAPVSSFAPNAFGLYDVHGNAAEWVAEGWLVGGSYGDEAADLAFGKRKKTTPAWNASDPQIPKSTWWLADAPFAGLRVVCEVAP